VSLVHELLPKRLLNFRLLLLIVVSVDSPRRLVTWQLVPMWVRIWDFGNRLVRSTVGPEGQGLEDVSEIPRIVLQLDGPFRFHIEVCRAFHFIKISTAIVIT
jgi:hypothetical protein